MTDRPTLAAGDFATWLLQTERAQQGKQSADVPCGECTACCRSSYFVHIEPDETDTLRRVPRELLFPAPGRPEGHVVLGYDHNGHCPMLVDDRCSIYEDRPRTCRTFDCRVFAAAGVIPDDDDEKLAIAERARRWAFAHRTSDDAVRHAAVQAAATFLREHPECFPPGSAAPSTTQLAVVAVDVHAMFLRNVGDAGALEVVTPEVTDVRAALAR